MKDLQRTGKAEYSSGEYFNRYKGTEYSFRVVVWCGEEYIVGHTTTYPDACPSDGYTGYILYPMAKAVGELAEHRERVRQWKLANPYRDSSLDIFHGPRWSILDKAEYGEEARRRYRNAMAEVEISDLQRLPELQASTLAQYAKENDPTRLFNGWSSSNGVGPDYLESLLRLDRLLTSAGIEHQPLCSYLTPEDFIALGEEKTRAMVDMVRMQGPLVESELQRIFENRWETIEYVVERRAKATA